MEKKGKGIAAVNGETLTEGMVERIQSFMTGKEAARTTILSKSWYNTWLTRSTLDFDEHDFNNGDGFVEFATNTMQRYRHSNVRIEGFRLRINNILGRAGGYFNTMIVDAMEIGATHLNLNFNLKLNIYNLNNIDIGAAVSVLLQEVLGCKTLTRLSLTEVKIDKRSVSAIGCWRLKSLSLERVHLESESVINDIFSSCIWIEELSLSECTGAESFGTFILTLSWGDMNRCNLQKLRSLSLKGVGVNGLFYSNLACFPCLKDLKVADCYWREDEARWTLGSSSLEHISFVDCRATILKLEFDVPNLRSFVYSSWDLPDLTFKSVGSRKWESHITIRGISTYRTRSWLLSFNELLTSLRPSRIFLTVCINTWVMLDCEGNGEITLSLRN